MSNARILLKCFLYSLSFNFADVAQLVEHFLGKEEVTGSIPVISSIKYKIKQLGGFSQ